MASTEQELRARIRQLEEQNSALQDKLDMIYAILAPDYEEPDEEPGLVQIEGAASGIARGKTGVD